VSFCTEPEQPPLGYFNASNTVNADYEFFHKALRERTRAGIVPGYVDRYGIQMKTGGNSSRGIRRVLRHNIGILRYILLNDPLLLPGFVLKPAHKIAEIVRARYLRRSGPG